MSKEVLTSTKRKKTEPLNIKDFMTIGVFFVINTVVAMVVSFIGILPVTYLLITVCQALVLGIPTMLFYSKVKKPGMLFIYGIISGGLGLLLGFGPFPLILGLGFAVICEYLLWSANYLESRKLILAYAIGALATTTVYIPLFFSTKSFIANSDMHHHYGQEMGDKLTQFGQYTYLFGIIIVATFMAGLIGGYIGRKTFKKHFERSGII